VKSSSKFASNEDFNKGFLFCSGGELKIYGVVVLQGGPRIGSVSGYEVVRVQLRMLALKMVAQEARELLLCARL
jgi:hypothetical protein